MLGGRIWADDEFLYPLNELAWGEEDLGDEEEWEEDDVAEDLDDEWDEDEDEDETRTRMRMRTTGRSGKRNSRRMRTKPQEGGGRGASNGTRLTSLRRRTDPRRAAPVAQVGAALGCSRPLLFAGT